MEEKRKTDWMKLLTLVLCAVLLIVNFWQGTRLRDLEQDVWNAQNSVMDSVSRLDGRVGSLRSDFEKANNLIQDWNHTVGVDRERKSLDVEIAVTLKEWGEDTAVELLWSNLNGGGQGAVPASGDGTGCFAGTLDLPLSGVSGEYTLEAVIWSGGVRRREDLGRLGDFAGLLPVQCNGWGVGGPEYTRDADKNGVLAMASCEAELGPMETLPQLSDQVFRLRRGGEVAVEATAVFGDRINHFTCGELSAEARIGDSFLLTFFCRDGSGLGYEFYLQGWTIGEDGIRVQAVPEAGWPKLTWD